MGVLDLWTDRHDVHAGDLFDQQSALESGVDRLELGLVAEELFIDGARSLDDGRAGVGFPPRVGVFDVDLGSGLSEY